MLDAIVIGAGHNGLTCAAYLAGAGKQVLVLEERDQVGGFCVTEKPVKEAPEFMATVAFDHVLTNIEPSIITELNLARHGLTFVAPDPMYTWLHQDGRSIRFWRNPERTIDEIGRFSRRDAEQYRRLYNLSIDVWKLAIPYLQDHPIRPRPSTVRKVVLQAARSHRSLVPAARMMLSSPAAVIEEWFESPEAQAALANFAIGSMAPIDEPGSGLVMMLLPVMHHWGVRRSVGGNGAFTQALASDVRARGGKIRTGTRVARIELHGSVAAGVVTDDGERISARHIVATVDPVTLCHRLIGTERLSDDVKSELRGLQCLGSNLSAFKGDVVVSRRPKLAGHDLSDAMLGGCLMLSPTLTAVRRATMSMAAGSIDDVPVWLSSPSIVDRALVPNGAEGDTLYVYLPSVPYELAGGLNWAEEKDGLLTRALDQFESFAPGTAETIVGQSASGPRDLAKYSDVHRGNLLHVDARITQMGPWRPTRSLSGYRTPWRGLWHAGAGAHPIGLLNGWSGRTVARRLVREL
jgi:beta-carotene ketolase (CrtO type)